MRRASRKLHRFELVSLDWEKTFPQCAKNFQECGCYPFCERIQGYNTEVIQRFTLNFNGSIVDLGGF